MSPISDITDTNGIAEKAVLIWNKKVPNTQLEDFRKKVSKKYNVELDNYFDLHEWSIKNPEKYWEEIWLYFDLISSQPWEQVFRRIGKEFLDVEWFPGVRFNVAENILRIRDDRVAIMCSDELGNEEEITYAELYEEVKLYAAAFRKHGLTKQDVVACCMPNRKEMVFIYLATLSSGAMVSGPPPFYGAKATNKIVKTLEPKFYITIDEHQYRGNQYNFIDILPEIVKDVPSLEKIIVIPTRPETHAKDLSAITNSCLLKEFLKDGIESDGSVPDLTFEQLPFNHPATISFTSGTTGLPKATVHPAGTIVSSLANTTFSWDMKPGEVLFTFFTFGWSVWYKFVHCLSRGVKLYMYAGNPVYKGSSLNIWDLFAKYKIAYVLMKPSILDALEKKNVQPAPDADMSHFKCISIAGSPVKIQNCLYMKNKVGEHIFVSSQYGATESCGSFSGIDFNLPAYAGENQAPALGMDIKCMGSDGQITKDVGIMVLAAPTPGLPVFIWKDKDNKILRENYLAKFPGYWCQNDDIVINPVTRGFKVLGRSDDVMLQAGLRFRSDDIYSTIHDMEEILDYICLGQTNNEGDTRAVLFIKMKDGYAFNPEFQEKVRQKITKELFFVIVPRVILEAKDIPYNVSNKRMEGVLKKILATNEIPEVNNIRNPECLQYFVNIPEIVDFMEM